jgi:2-dehydropantoate 2-reductase
VKIAVIGVGAMGSVYAALLADAGNEVSAIDVSSTHISAIRERGLRVEGASGDRVVHLHATDDPAEVGTVDVVIIATKAMHVRAAAEGVRPLLGPETVVLPIQNGLGSSDAVAEVVGADRVVVGVAGGFGASVISPGHAHHHGLELVRLGELSGPSTPRLDRIADVWRAAGFTVATFDDIDRLVWEKLVCNVAFSGPCAVLDATIGEVLESEHAWSIASACAVEAFDVAVADGVGLGFDDPVAYVSSFGRAIAGARPSLALDLRAGRPTEIDVINGAIPPRAAELGLPAPCNTTIVALVRALEARQAYSDSRA